MSLLSVYPVGIRMNQNKRYFLELSTVLFAPFTVFLHKDGGGCGVAGEKDLSQPHDVKLTSHSATGEREGAVSVRLEDGLTFPQDWVCQGKRLRALWEGLPGQCPRCEELAFPLSFYRRKKVVALFSSDGTILTFSRLLVFAAFMRAWSSSEISKPKVARNVCMVGVDSVCRRVSCAS